MKHLLGAHQSIFGGYEKSVERIVKIGGNCLQIFSASPRGWNFTPPDKEKIDSFLKARSGHKISPVYFHASYLINLADDGRIGNFSKLSLINELNLAPKMNIRGSVIHLGSYKKDGMSDRSFHKYRILIENIKEILEKTPKDSMFIIENAGNRKIGQTLEEISKIMADLDDSRVRLCLDTCHLFSNGYRFTDSVELDKFLGKLNKLSLSDRLEVWHLNDSRDIFDSGHDRHTNIGQGNIPTEEFKALLNHQVTKNFPFIIETPGFDDEGPDKKNLDILKSYIDEK